MSFKDSALIVIDVQDAFKHKTHWGTSRSNPSFEQNLHSLLTAWRALPAGPIFFIQHASTSTTSPLHFSNPGYQLQSGTHVAGEPILVKSVNSAFIGTDLEWRLRAAKIRRVFLVGLTTDQCVSTSVRMAANLGVVNGEWGVGSVVLVEDATATWAKGMWDAETVHSVHVESLRGEFCEVWKTAELCALLAER